MMDQNHIAFGFVPTWIEILSMEGMCGRTGWGTSISIPKEQKKTKGGKASMKSLRPRGFFFFFSSSSF